MDGPEIIRTLKAHEADLRRRGVEHVALFGSLARGEGRLDSDIDIMLDLDPAVRVTVWDYAEIVEYIRSLVGSRADVANRETLRSHIRPSAEREALRAF
jgi:predicted nucleotidyltransferase